MADVDLAIDIMKIIYSNKIIDNVRQNKLEKIEKKLFEIMNKKVNKAI
jgi:hypothetical protein